MNKSYWVLLSFILIEAILANAPPALDTVDVPIVIDLSNTNQFDQNEAMDFCADENWLILNTTSLTYSEKVGTMERFPSCVYNITSIMNYSDLGLSPRQILLLPKIKEVLNYDMICLRAKCRRGITVDFTNGNARLVWQNDSFKYP